MKASQIAFSFYIFFSYLDFPARAFSGAGLLAIIIKKI